VATLDASRYAAHVALHRVPALWRLHRVHHSDRAVDCSTSLRFHPLEALVTAGVQLVVVAALGAPVAAVIVCEAATILVGLFAHGNVRMPARVDAWLRRALVTPDMHRIHHSVDMRESNRNFGVVLSCWDWLFGTYVAQPTQGHDAIVLGLAEIRDARASSLGWLLVSPFVSASTFARGAGAPAPVKQPSVS
jgi:sterol desaturase/sphingolipid hydroxylase (fatty acid hydroxylase superfamily)